MTVRSIEDVVVSAPRLIETAASESPFKTVDDLKRLATAIGVSRLGDATKLDRIDAYNFYAIRPGALNPACIYTSGKGFSAFEAQTGAVFESFERWAAEAPACCFDATPAAVAEVAARAGAIIYLAHELAPHTPVRWAVGRRLFDSTVSLAPVPMIAFPALDPAYLPNTTSGLAGHFSQSLAIEAAILERFERHAAASLTPERLQRVGANAISSRARRLLDSMDVEDIECAVFRIDHGASLAIQVAYAFAFDHWLGVPQSHCSGYGAALTLANAVDRALLEVSQSRAAFLTGMRDDVACQVLPKSIDLLRLERQSAWLKQLRVIRSFATSENAPEALLEVLRRAVSEAHLTEPAVFPLRSAKGAEAVRVLVPGLVDAV